MMRTRQEAGFTLIELLVGMVITLVVFAAVLAMLNIFLNDSRTDQVRNEVQDNVRSAIDRMSRQLRNVAAPSAALPGALELAGPYDLVFQTVSSSQTFGGVNGSNQMRVRYCLSKATPSNETLWMQTQTWTTTASPSVPGTSTCPASIIGGGWQTQYKLVTNITNENDGQGRELFAYAPIGSKSPSQIDDVNVDMFLDLNPGKPPGETELKSGIFLRNSFASPIARFTLSQVSGEVQLDASASSDPNGQGLTYQWAVDGTPMSQATTQKWDAGTAGTTFAHNSVHAFTLTVTSTGGLTAQVSQTVTIA
jgi:prepilin-type N-terminal cleavage/methylation domain-containing protein